jgi:hypothetical protein
MFVFERTINSKMRLRQFISYRPPVYKNLRWYVYSEAAECILVCLSSNWLLLHRFTLIVFILQEHTAQGNQQIWIT